MGFSIARCYPSGTQQLFCDAGGGVGGGFSLPLSDAEHGAEFKPPGLKVQLGERGGVGSCLPKTFSFSQLRKECPVSAEKSRRVIFTTQGEKQRGSRIKLVHVFE